MYCQGRFDDILLFSGCHPHRKTHAGITPEWTLYPRLNLKTFITLLKNWRSIFQKHVINLNRAWHQVFGHTGLIAQIFSNNHIYQVSCLQGGLPLPYQRPQSVAILIEIEISWFPENILSWTRPTNKKYYKITRIARLPESPDSTKLPDLPE